MCGFFGDQNYSFKWNTYLVIVSGLYTFAHWFLATPLSYSHIYECCNERWPKNWVVWYLATSFAIWLAVVILILLLWFCARNRCGNRIEKSNSCTNAVEKQNKNKSNDSNSEFVMTKIEKENTELKTLVLPNMADLNDKLTVVNLNENKNFEKPNDFETNIPIPIDETRSFIQLELPLQNVKEKNFRAKNALKTPREIFFQDLIAAASSNSSGTRIREINEKDLDNDDRLTKESILTEVEKGNYFENKKKKIEQKEEKENDKIKENIIETRNVYFMGSSDLVSNFKSEIFIELGEKEKS